MFVGFIRTLRRGVGGYSGRARPRGNDMKATASLLAALVLFAVSGVHASIPDPVLAAGTGSLYPGSDTETDTWREDNTLLVVGALRDRLPQGGYDG